MQISWHGFKIPDLPFTQPVVVFTILITIILLAPIVFRKFRIPGIVGLIVSGIIIGPHALNLVEFGESIKLLGTAGLLYLMFLAGLELNFRQLMHNRNKSIVFGSLTFIVPLIFGFVVAYYLLEYSLLAALLIASMFSTHTLVSYPIASRLGIIRSEAVTITIGGTIITDTTVLVLLSFISAATRGSLDLLFWIKIIISLSLFSFLILWGVPKLTAWFFKNLEGESGSQYIYVLAILFISSLLAQSAGVEPIIGAFLAGLALSNLISPTSALMNRISFIGNNLFIPIFLLSVGLMVDLTVFLGSTQAIIFALSLVVVAILSKFIAAWITQKIYGYSVNERQVIFGLSVSHAAAIIAVVIVGFDLGLIRSDILNGAIMIILVSCLASSILTERAGKKLAVDESKKNPSADLHEERILVPVANPATVESLVDFAILIHTSGKKSPMYMLSVVPDNEFAQEQILRNKKMYENAIKHAAAAEKQLIHISRVSLNVASGIGFTAKDLMINKIVLGWNGRITTTNFFFGSIVDNLIANNEQMVLVVKTSRPPELTRRIVLLLPRNTEFEAGFPDYMQVINTLAGRLSSSLLIIAHNSAEAYLRIYNTEHMTVKNPEYKFYTSTHPLAEYAPLIKENDLYIVVSARKTTLSYNHYHEHMPRDLARYHENHNFVIIYPWQKITKTFEGILNEEYTENHTVETQSGRFSDMKTKQNYYAGNRHGAATE